MSGYGRVFTELHFETADTAYPAVQLSVELDCRVDLLEFLHTDADGLVIFVRLQSEDGGELRMRIESIDVDAELRVLQAVGKELLAEYVPEQSIVGTLARNGVIPQSAVATEGLASITGVVPGDSDSRGVVVGVVTLVYLLQTGESVGNLWVGFPGAIVVTVVMVVVSYLTPEPPEDRANEFIYEVREADPEDLEGGTGQHASGDVPADD